MRRTEFDNRQRGEAKWTRKETSLTNVGVFLGVDADTSDFNPGGAWIDVVKVLEDGTVASHLGGTNVVTFTHNGFPFHESYSDIIATGNCEPKNVEELLMRLENSFVP